MKKILFLMALVLGSYTANAQITTGENTAKVIRTGNRAQKGNFGLYLGATTDMLKNIGDGDVKFSALPLINLKYMYTDKTEFRFGFEMWECDTVKSAANQSDYKGTESRYMFYPGIAYHFSNKNLLDVYVGGEIPFGWGTKTQKNALTDGAAYLNGYQYAQDMSYFHVGVGAFVGLQCYLGNLPIAVGCEYGVQTIYSHCYNGTMDKDGYNLADGATTAFNTGESKFKVGHQIRLTLSYYFNL